jgi:hypothetical protein
MTKTGIIFSISMIRVYLVYDLLANVFFSVLLWVGTREEIVKEKGHVHFRWTGRMICGRYTDYLPIVRVFLYRVIHSEQVPN